MGYHSASNSKISIKSVITVLVLAILVFLLYSCVTYSPPPPEKKNVYLIVGNVQGSPKIEIQDSFIDEISKFYKEKNGFTIIVPSKENSKTQFIPSGSDSILNKKDIKERLPNILEELKPNSNNVDYLDAILKIDDENPQIYVIGSGLNDTGDLNFSKYPNLLDEGYKITENDIFENLKKSCEKFNGRVVWFNLGETNSPQPSLDNQEINQLKTIYSDLFDGLEIKEMPTEGSYEGSHTVDIVNHIKVDLSWTEVTLGDDKLSFLEDSTSFKDENKATKLLESISSSIKNSKFTIEGYCDCKGEDTSIAQLRADKIKDIFVNYGIDESFIQTENKGNTGKDKNSARNRKIVIRRK